MPAKGKRVASRQAQINRRRRRQARTGSESSADTAVSDAEPATATVAAPATATRVASAPAETAVVNRQQPAATESRPARTAAGQSQNTLPMAYTHLPMELRRILILAGVLTVVLIALSFFI